MSRSFKIWLAGLLLTAILAQVSVVWLDKPVALWIHNLFDVGRIREPVAHSPALSIPLAASLVFAIFGLLAIMGRTFSRIELAILFCDISVFAAEAIKDQLKFVFGRTWPDSWDPQIISLIRDNVYGFNFFHPGRSFESFPSGHAATAAAMMSVLWMLFPRLRALWAIGLCATGVGLVLLNLHFVSDVIAGAFVGASSGLFTVTLFASMFCEPQLP